MQLGVTIFATDQTMDMVEVARATEERGFSSLWLPEHTHIPVTRKTTPPVGGGELPPEYRRTLDPLVSLGAVAAATTDLRIGTGILLPAQREPIVTAKALATLDHISGGRLEVGVGFGWNEDELERIKEQNFKNEKEFRQFVKQSKFMRDRREVVAESVGAMRALWTEEEASFHGRFVEFDPSWSWPKPVQTPLPVLLGGGNGAKLREHLVAWAVGWIPIGGSGLGEALPVLRRELEDAGRDPDGFPIVPFGSIPTPPKLEYFSTLGIREVVVRLPSAGRDEVLATLDEYAPLIEVAATLR